MPIKDSGPIEIAEIIYEKPASGDFEEVLFGSDRGNTLWIKFSDRDGITEWVGKFGCGISTQMRITKVVPPETFLVVAGGYGYLLNGTKRLLINQYLSQSTEDIAYDPHTERLIASDGIRIRFVENGNVIWCSPRIALDGISNLSLAGRTLRGQAVTGYEGQEEAFALELDTKKIICGTDYSSWDRHELFGTKPVSTKRWWRFW